MVECNFRRVMTYMATGNKIPECKLIHFNYRCDEEDCILQKILRYTRPFLKVTDSQPDVPPVDKPKGDD